MKHKLILLLFLSLPIQGFCQPEGGKVKKVAILEVVDREGNVAYGIKLQLRSTLAKSVTMTPGYEGYDRVDITSILGEQDFQHTGMVSDSDIHKLGEITGADYILVAEAARLNSSALIITAKILDVETAQLINTDLVQTKTNPKSLANNCHKLAASLLARAPQEKLPPKPDENYSQKEAEEALAKLQAEEQAKARAIEAAEEARRQAEVEKARRQAEVEKARRQAEEARRQAEAEKARRQAEEARRQAEVEKARRQAEVEEARMQTKAKRKSRWLFSGYIEQMNIFNLRGGDLYSSGANLSLGKEINDRFFIGGGISLYYLTYEKQNWHNGYYYQNGGDTWYWKDGGYTYSSGIFPAADLFVDMKCKIMKNSKLTPVFGLKTGAGYCKYGLNIQTRLSAGILFRLKGHNELMLNAEYVNAAWWYYHGVSLNVGYKFGK